MPDKERKIYDWKTRKYVSADTVERKKPTFDQVKQAIAEEDIFVSDQVQTASEGKITVKNLNDLRQHNINELTDEEVDSAVRSSLANKHNRVIGLRTYQVICLFPPQCRNRAPRDLMERGDLVKILEDFRYKIERCLGIICKDDFSMSNDFNNKGLKIAFKSEQDCHDFIFLHKNFFTELNGKLYVRDTDTNHTEEYEITETKKGYLII